MIIPPFRPDAGELNSGTLNNVFMVAGGYGPRPTLSPAPGAAVFASGAQVRGGIGLQVPGGAYKGFLASATKVYTLNSDYSYTALTPTFAVPTGEDERFTQFGVFMLCSNTTDGLYAYNMQTPAGLNAVSGAPKARDLFVSNNILVLLGDGSNSARLSTTAFGDYTNFTSKGALQIDLNDGGAFTGGSDLGGPHAILFQQRAVRLMTFGPTGTSAPYALSLLASDVGCVHPRAFAVVNGTAYWLDTKGFFACNGATAPVNIGANKVNKWFLANCPDLTKVYASVDPANTIIRFRYRSATCNSDIVFTDLIDYNYVENEFIPHTENTSWVFRMATPGYTLATLASTFGVLANWAQYPIGSPVWLGGNNPQLAGLDSTGKFGFFNGSTAAATLETNTVSSGVSQNVTRIEPLTDDPSVTAQIGVKDTLGGSISWASAVAITPSGRAPIRGRGKFQRFRLNHPAASSVWTRTTSIESIEAYSGGPR